MTTTIWLILLTAAVMVMAAVMVGDRLKAASREIDEALDGLPPDVRYTQERFTRFGDPR